MVARGGVAKISVVSSQWLDHTTGRVHLYNDNNMDVVSVLFKRLLTLATESPGVYFGLLVLPFM